MGARPRDLGPGAANARVRGGGAGARVRGARAEKARAARVRCVCASVGSGARARAGAGTGSRDSWAHKIVGETRERGAQQADESGEVKSGPQARDFLTYTRDAKKHFSAREADTVGGRRPHIQCRDSGTRERCGASVGGADCDVFRYSPPSRALGSLTATQPVRVTKPTQGHPGSPWKLI